MAVYNLPNYLAKDGFGMSLNIRRGNPNPLDNSSVWASLAEAKNYAKTDPVAYVGQILTVVTDVKVKEMVDGQEVEKTVKTATAYVIDNEAGDLKEVGSSPVGDEKSITVSEDGTVSLYGIAGLALTREVEKDGETVTEKINYQPLLVDGKLTWVEPSATTVEGLATEIEGIKTRLGALETTVGKAAEGENEATGLVKAVADIEAKIGVEASEGVEATGLEKKIADNATAIDGKVDKVDGKGLSTNDLTDELKANYDAAYEHSQVAHAPADAQANVIEKIKVNGTEQTITDKAVDIAIPTKVSELENDSNYLTAIPDDYVTEDELTAKGYQTASDVETIVGSAIAEINHAVFQKVDAVPAVEDAETNVLYLVPNGEKMDIYAKIGEEMVLIDDTDTDLSGYALKSELHEHANKELIDTYDQSNDDIKSAVEQKHTHTFTDEDVNDAIAKEHEHANKTLLDAYTQTEEDLADAVAKKHEHGNATILDAITEEKVAAWDEAEKNVISSVDEAQFNVDADGKLTLLDIAMGKVTGLSDALDGKANKGTTLAEYGITDAYTKSETEGRIQEVLDGLSDTSETAASVAQALETYKTSNDQRVETIEGKLNGIEAGAQVNVIEGIKFNGTTVTVGEDKIANITYALPIANADTIGGVKSVEALIGEDGKISNASVIENKIKVAEDGTMEVNSLNVNKLVQTSGEYLIMNGGSAAL